MRFLKWSALSLLLILGWMAFLLYGTSNGFLLRGLTSDEAPEAFVEAAAAMAAETDVHNLAVVVIENGEAQASHFYSKQGTIGSESVFPMASVSKWVTAWGVFRLVQEGRLDLDVPVDSYLTRWNLPDSEFDNAEVTLRRLLGHTSGLVDDLGYAGFGPDETLQTIEESLTQAADSPWSEGRAVVGIEPGIRYFYSGAAYTIMQLVIEEVSGQSFQDFMTETVFGPLRMQHSTFVWSDSSAGERVALADTAGNPVSFPRFTALAAASLHSTAADLERFLAANLRPNEVLSSETLDLMYTPEAFVNETAIHALGPTIFARNGEGVIIHGHDGSGDLINTAVRVYRATGDGIIVLETGHPNLASTIADHWVFWSTGIADFVVITSNRSWLLTLLALGIVAILAVVIWRARVSVSRASAPIPGQSPPAP